MPNVTTPVIKLINFLKSRALNHRQFNEFLKDLGSEYGDVIYNTEVRWLSRGAMLKRVYNLKNDSIVCGNERISISPFRR
jgi:hypothetical protein